jgi:hypothetical protein
MLRKLSNLCLWLLFFLLAMLSLTSGLAPLVMGLAGGAPLLLGWGLSWLLWKGARFVLGELIS